MKRGWWTICVRFVICVATAWLCGGIRSGPSGQVGWTQEVVNRFLPPPRVLLQRLARGKQAIQEGAWNVAVEELGAVLAPDRHQDEDGDLDQDYFIQSADNRGAMPSLRREAQRLIGELPPAARELYELRYGAVARQQLEEAVRENNLTKLTEVTRKYFHTRAGYEAMLLLGRHYMDEGMLAAAALCLDRLAMQPVAVQLFEPELSLMRAFCHAFSGQINQAAHVLVDLRRRLPTAALKFGSEDVPRWTDVSQAEAWLRARLRPEVSTGRTADWIMHRGSADRNASSDGSMPVASLRWQVPVANNPEDEELLKEQQRQRYSSDQFLWTSLSPIAVGDTVLVRTVDRVMGVNLNTGKRIWEYPWDETPDERAARSAQTAMSRAGMSPRTYELSERVWLDAPYGQLASDGKNVYLLDELSLAGPVGNPMVIGIGGVAFPNNKAPKPFNKLVALSIARQGALEWIVGGPDGGDEPALANAFFLGAPLPVMGQLLVMAEVTGELRLVVLNPSNGRLLWQQQVAHVDTFTITQDGRRRLAGASPSYADGVLVCPTSAGAVVAIDLATRALLWGFQYGLANAPGMDQAMIQLRVNRLNAAAAGTSADDWWADATAAVAEGRVILTPPETDQVYCLDLLTGAERWKVKRDGAMYVACVAQGQVLLVGKHSVKALSLADGTESWPATLALASESVTGRGFLSAGYYYLPTSAPRILKIDISTGTIVEATEVNGPLGNLICHADQVISQTHDAVTAYFQVEALERWVQERLARDPADRDALARKCELLIQRGQRREAIHAMWELYRRDPTDEGLKSRIVETYLKGLDEDFAGYVEMRSQVEPLIDQPSRKAAYLRQLSAGLQAMERWDEAFAAVLQLADLPTEPDGREQLERLDRQWSARPRLWVQSRMASLWAATEGPAYVAMRQRWQAEIHRRLREAETSSSRYALRKFLDQFGALPVARQARFAYAQQLLRAGEFAGTELLEAELQLAALIDAADKEIDPRALVLLTELYLRCLRLVEAELCCRTLETFPPETALGEGRSVASELARLRTSLAERIGKDAQAPWPYSRVVAKVNTDLQRSYPLPVYTYTVPVEEARGVWPEGNSVWADLRMNALMVRDPWGRIIHQAMLNPSGAQFGAMYNLARAKALGHLLVVMVQGDVVAMNTLRSGPDIQEAVLWRSDLTDATGNFLPRRLAQRPLSHPWSQSGVRTVLADASNQRLPTSGVGVVCADGVCFIRYRQLVCVDPVTGQELWTRDGIEPGSQLFGDERYLFVVGYDQTEASVFSTTTGEFLGKRPSERMENRWTTWGTHVLAWSEQSGQLVLRVYDAWTQQELWRGAFAIGSRGELIGGDEVAVYQSTGELVVVSIREGRELLRTRLVPVPAPAYLYISRDADSYYVLPGTPPSPGNRPAPLGSVAAGSSTPVMQGHLYALDRRTGQPRWPSPAYFDGFHLASNPPSATPLLVLYRALQRSGGNRFSMSMVCVDKRDGRALFVHDELPIAQPNMISCEIVAEPENASITINAGNNEVSLQWTGEPCPPAPPIQLGPDTNSATGS